MIVLPSLLSLTSGRCQPGQLLDGRMNTLHAVAELPDLIGPGDIDRQAFDVGLREPVGHRLQAPEALEDGAHGDETHESETREQAATQRQREVACARDGPGL